VRDLQVVDSFPSLESPCEKCQGRGWYSFGAGEREDCPMCDGAGYSPTAFGEKVLALMRHNFKPMLRSVAKT
jgi:DnaJ-class molecular chaperone